MSKRRFGRVRRLPSGRYQARYLGPDGVDRPADSTFASKRDAEIWLTHQEVAIRAGDWIDPDLGKVEFGSFAAAWLRDRVLKPRTAELYEGLLRNHLLPFFGNCALGDIREADIRRWRKERLDAGPAADRPFGAVTVAKAYRLLHAMLATAADDKVISRNPCRIRGAGEEHSPERPVLALSSVLRLLDCIPPRYRATLLLATFASLRFGELAALQRADLDLDGCVVRVVRSTALMNDGRLIEQEPKSRAGRRTVAFPREIVGELRWHLECFAEPGSDGLVFVGPQGGRLRRSNFRDLWLVALKDAGIGELHLLSRPGARFRCCHRPVSPGRSPNPSCPLLSNGLSTVVAVRRGSQVARGAGSCSPGRRSGRPSRPRSGSTPPRPPRSPTARRRP